MHLSYFFAKSDFILKHCKFFLKLLQKKHPDNVGKTSKVFVCSDCLFKTVCLDIFISHQSVHKTEVKISGSDQSEVLRVLLFKSLLSFKVLVYVRWPKNQMCQILTNPVVQLRVLKQVKLFFIKIHIKKMFLLTKCAFSSYIASKRRCPQPKWICSKQKAFEEIA